MQRFTVSFSYNFGGSKPSFDAYRQCTHRRLVNPISPHNAFVGSVEEIKHEQLVVFKFPALELVEFRFLIHTFGNAGSGRSGS